MARNNNRRKTNIVLKKGLWIRCGRHHPQFMRPWEVNATTENIETLLEEMGNVSIDRGQEDLLGGYGSDIIYARGQVEDEDEALVPYGWDAERLRFFLVLELESRVHSGHSNLFYVTGFSENDTMERTGKDEGSLDPDTRLFINSIMGLKLSEEASNLDDILGADSSSQRNFRVATNMHLLGANTDDDKHSRDQRDFVTIRPYDLATELSSDADRSTIQDSRRSFQSRKTKASSRSNTTANSYLSRSLSGLVRGEREAETKRNFHGSSESGYDTAQNLLGESSGSKDKLNRILMDETNYKRNGYITYEELEDLVIGLDDNRYNIFMESSSVEDNVRIADEEGEHWHGSDNETVQTYQALNSVSGLMSESAIMQCSFTAHNEDGAIEFAFLRGTAPIFIVDGMDEDQEEDLVEMFESRLERFVLEPLENAVGDFWLRGNIDVVGDSFFEMSIQGEASVEYAAPTFADGSTSSLITSDKRHGGKLAKDVNKLAAALLG